MNSGKVSRKRVRRPAGVFVCHSSKDSRTSRKIAKSLIRRGCHVWYDEWAIKVGDSITKKISEGLKQGDFLVLVLSKHSVLSPWVQMELSLALVMELEERSIFILPALIDECEIPLAIRDKKYADFRRSFGEGLDELSDTMRSPTRLAKEPPQSVRMMPPREPNLRDFVDSLVALTPDEMQKRISKLNSTRKKQLIIEIFDMIAMLHNSELPTHKALFQALETCTSEEGRPSAQLFEVLFREFAVRSLPVARDEVLRIIARLVGFSQVREWVRDQGMTDWFVSEFVNSGSFSIAGINAEIVTNLQPVLTKDHIRKIVDGALKNNQIYESWVAPAHLKRLFALSKKWIPSNEEKALKKLSLLA